MVLPLIFGDKRPQVYRAAETGDTNFIREYLARGSNVNALVTSYKAGHLHAPLIYGAVGGGQPDVVDVLLNNGANPNQPNSGGDTPLLRIIGRDQTEPSIRILKTLLKAGADPNLKSSSGFWTPLIFAADLGQSQMVSILLSSGADFRATNSDGLTALHYAENAEVARLLIAAGADRTARSGSETPAESAIRLGHLGALAVITNRLTQTNN
jgi:ankyrin repeat protein